MPYAEHTADAFVVESFHHLDGAGMFFATSAFLFYNTIRMDGMN